MTTKKTTCHYIHLQTLYIHLPFGEKRINKQKMNLHTDARNLSVSDANLLAKEINMMEMMLDGIIVSTLLFDNIYQNQTPSTFA